MPDLGEIKLNITGTIPGEQIVASIFRYAEISRATMSQENRDAWDKRALEVYDDWVKFWITLGIIKR